MVVVSAGGAGKGRVLPRIREVVKKPFIDDVYLLRSFASKWVRNLRCNFLNPSKRLLYFFPGEVTKIGKIT